MRHAHTVATLPASLVFVSLSFALIFWVFWGWQGCLALDEEDICDDTDVDDPAEADDPVDDDPVAGTGTRSHTPVLLPATHLSRTGCWKLAPDRKDPAWA